MIPLPPVVGYAISFFILAVLTVVLVAWEKWH